MSECLFHGPHRHGPCPKCKISKEELQRLRRVEQASRDFLRDIGGPDHDKAMDKLIDALDNG